MFAAHADDCLNNTKGLLFSAFSIMSSSEKTETRVTFTTNELTLPRNTDYIYQNF